MTHANIFERLASASTNKIISDEQHPLHIYILNGSEVDYALRLLSLIARTNRHRDTAVPSFIKLLDKTPNDHLTTNQKVLNTMNTTCPTVFNNSWYLFE